MKITPAFRTAIEHYGTVVGVAMNLNSLYFIARDTCPVCASPDGSALYSAPMTQDPVRSFIDSHYRSQGTVDWSLLEGTDYTLLECPRCALIYQYAAPNDLLTAAIYDTMIAPAFLDRLERERLTVKGFNRIAGELGVLFARTGKHPSDITMLDYGSGHGRWARVARALGARVFATEISPDKIAIAATIGVEIISDEAIGDIKFDIVQAEQVMEHLPDPRATFRRLAAATEGILKVAIPPTAPIRRMIARYGLPKVSPLETALKGRRKNRQDAAWNAIQPLEHLNCFSPASIAWLADENDMTVVGTRRRRNITIQTDSLAGFTGTVAAAGFALWQNFVPEAGYFVLSPAMQRSTVQRQEISSAVQGA